MDWNSLFDEAQPEPGASDAEIERFVVSIARPLTELEVAEVNRSQGNPFPVGDSLHATYI